MTEQTTEGPRGPIVPATLGMICSFLGPIVLNYNLFSSYRATWAYVPDLSTVVGIAFLAFIALACFANPKILRVKTIAAVMIACAVCGVATLALAMFDVFPIPSTIVGATLLDIASEWALLVSGLALSRVHANAVPKIVSCSLIVACLAGPLIGSLPFAAALACFAACCFVPTIACTPEATKSFEAACKSVPPSEAIVTNPLSYLPLNSKFFIVLALFQGVFGYSTTFQPGASFPILTAIPLAALLFWAMWKSQARIDTMFSVLGIMVVAALTIPRSGTVPDVTWLATLASSTGTFGFLALITYAFAAAAARNERGAVTVFAWGNALCSASIVVGGGLGYLVAYLNSTGALSDSIPSAFLALLTITYLLVGLKGFSLSDTIMGIDREIIPVADSAAEGVDQAGLPAESTPDIDTRCDSLAKARGLTPRETDVLRLLARGRNSGYIQDELGISRNTVKIHVSHVYQKLGIHRQQDLIDLVEMQ